MDADIAPREPKIVPVNSVITRTVKPGHEPAFETWLHGISQAAARFPGHHSVTILRPRAGDREYTIVLQFDREENLKAWLESDVRREWVERSKADTEGEERRAVVSGLEHWFTLPGKAAPHRPPPWKMATLTILVVYPTILALNAILAPVLRSVPHPIGPLIVTICLTLLLTYLLMPNVTRLAYSWLYLRERT